MTRRVAGVTGAAGFVGRHLLHRLKEDGFEAFGIDRAESLVEGIPIIAVDILDRDGLSELFATRRPSVVFHLAAVAAPAQADEDPASAVRVNVEGALSVLGAIDPASDCSFLQVGTSHMYGPIEADDAVLTETDAVGADSVYGITKEFAERLVACTGRRGGRRVFLTRSFNHTGPGQAPIYAVGSFVRQAVEFARGDRIEVAVGDISVARDLLDVRDVVNAYVAIVTAGRPYVPYNVSSGRAVTLESLLRLALQEAGCPDAPILASGVGTGRPRSITGSCKRLTSDTGWAPTIPVEQTVRDMVRFEVERRQTATREAKSTP